MMEQTYLLPGLTTPRLLFRLLDQADFSLCLPFFENPLSYQYWSTGGKDGRTLCAEWYEKQQWRYATNRGGAMAVLEKTTEVLVGWCGLLVQDIDGRQELEVGYSMLPACWGKGYATEAALACMKAAFEKNLTQSLISIIQVDNLPSKRVAEKNGLWIDVQTSYHGNPVYIYRIRKDEWMRSKNVTA